MTGLRSILAASIAILFLLAGCSTQQIARFESNVARNQCVEHGNPTYCAMAVDRGVEAYNAGQYDEAASLWNEPARRGNAAAQHNLGLLWRDGLGSTPRDLNQAAHWFLQAAVQGFPLAMVNLAKVQLDLDQPDPALSWLSLAARWNSAEAIALLQQIEAPVPAPDLYMAQQQHLAAQQQQLVVQQAQASQNLGQGLGLLTCALVGGGAGCGPQGTQMGPSSRGATTIYELRSDVLQNWEHICRYADGTVINSSRQRCPASISARQ